MTTVLDNVEKVERKKKKIEAIRRVDSDCFNAVVVCEEAVVSLLLDPGVDYRGGMRRLKGSSTALREPQEITMRLAASG